MIIPDPVGPDRRRTGFATLQPNGTVRIAKLVLVAEIPEDGAEHEVVLKYEDGFKTATSQPVKNVVTFGGGPNDPVRGECRFTLKKETPSMQVPGDSDQNGSLDLADAISIFGTLFQGSPKGFPCGDGSPSDSGNMALLDWQDDGAIDITDGIAALRFLFLGGPAHRLAVPGNELRGCVPVYGCPEGASCK